MRKMLVAVVFLLAMTACTPEEYMAFVHPTVVAESQITGKSYEEVDNTKWQEAINYSVWHAEMVARQQHPFLTCTRRYESDRSGWPYVLGYNAVSPTGSFRGAYQFHRGTWNNVARMAGRYDLIGADPAKAAWYDQDELALFLYNMSGNRPWQGRC